MCMVVKGVNEQHGNVEDDEGSRGEEGMAVKVLSRSEAVRGDGERSEAVAGGRRRWQATLGPRKGSGPLRSSSEMESKDLWAMPVQCVIQSNLQSKFVAPSIKIDW